MLKTLVLARVGTLFKPMFRGSNNGKKRGIGFKIVIAIFAIYLVGCFAVMFGSLFQSLVEPFSMANLEWLYFAFMGIMVITLCFFGTVFSTQSQLYDAKDNELLLSMPIPPKYILASRMAMILLLTYIIEALIVIPAGVVYCLYTTVTVPVAICFFVAWVILPFLVLTITCIFGWILAFISSKLRNKNMITMIFSLGFLFAYFAVISKLQAYINTLILHGEEIGKAIEKSVYPIYHLGKAIAEGNWVSLGLFAICCLGPFLMMYIILSESFIKIATAKKGAARIKYKERTMKVQSVKKALIGKEIRHFISNPMYMMNAGLGLVFLLVIAGMIVFKGESIIEMFDMAPELKNYFGPGVAIMLGVCCSTNIISAPSVSLEGKNLWIAQSLPVDAGEILTAKAYMQIVISLPFIVVAATICNIVVDTSILVRILMYLLPIAFTSLEAFGGVAINLKFPKFDWISETVAVKQSISSMITMFASFGVIISLGALYLFVLASRITLETYLFDCVILLFALSFLLYRYLITRGKRIFEAF